MNHLEDQNYMKKQNGDIMENDLMLNISERETS
jgi:hypothetical protein